MYKMASSWPAAILAGLCFFTSGCIPSLEGNAPREPNKQMPSSFAVANDSANATSPNTSISATSETPAFWRDFFDSPELRALVETALAKNQEINIELQEIIIARTEVSARQGAYLPKINAGVGVGLDRAGKYTSRGLSDDAHRLPENLGDFAFGLQGSWEIDVWGKLRNAVKSADLRYLASIESRNFIMTQIVAELARSYFELITVDNLLDVLKKILKSCRKPSKSSNWRNKPRE